MSQILSHVLFGAQTGGCETNSRALIAHLPHVQHRVVVLSNEGPMTSEWTRLGAEQSYIEYHTLNTNRKLIDHVRKSTKGSSAVMFWHGIVELPQLIRAVNVHHCKVGVHGGNPVHTMPTWVDAKFVILSKIHTPGGPLPVYICCSQYVADSFDSSRYLRRFPRVVIPNGVILPPTRHHPKPYDHSRPFVIGMVARLDTIKDHATLVRAFALVQKQFPNAMLEFAGDGEEMSALRQLTESLQLSDRIRFHGNVKDVYSTMDRWDLFAYATTKREGLGNAVAEAMMLGLPCVVTDVGPTHEFAGDEADPCVLLTKPHDPQALASAIVQLIPDFEQRTLYATRGREYAWTKYHPNQFAQSYARVLGLQTTST
jgi:glycosyltransferase involved in cell wall biosynthesis